MQEIIDIIREELLGTEKAQVSKRYTDKPEAYNLLLKARYFWGKRTREGLEKGVSFIQLGTLLVSQYMIIALD